MDLTQKSYYKWVVFITVSIGTYMAALDSSIVNISMPTITRYFGSNIATTNWVVAIYLLTLTGLLLIFGKLSDVISRKKIFTLGLTLFTLSSVTCGLSGSLLSLTIWRGLQAIGGAMIMSNGPAILTEAFPPQERGKALGTIGMVVAMGIMTGAPLGGKIVSAFSWRYIFFINIPVGILGTILAAVMLKDVKRDNPIKEIFDFTGAIFLVIFLISFLLGLNLGARGGFMQSKVIILFAVSILFFYAFIVAELRVSSPTIELHLFKNMGFTSANMSALFAYMTIFMLMFMMPFFLERVKGLSPGIIGAILITPTTMLFIFSPIFGWASDKIGYRFFRCGGLTLMGSALFLISHITRSTEITSIVAMLLLYGFGMGMFTPPNSSLLMGSVPKNKLGVAGGMLATTRNMGMMMGVAASSAIFTHQLKFYAAERMIDIAEIQKLHMPYSDVFLSASLICIFGVIAASLQGKPNVR